jgi:hypothetical protein
MVSGPHCGERATSAGPLTDMRRHATADTRLQIHLQNAGPMTALQCGARDDLRRGEYFEFLRFSFHSGATIVIHERERSSTNRGPPGSRSRHLGIKRGMHIVGFVRWCRNHPRIKETLSGGAGLVCGMKCGKSERSRLFSLRVHAGPSTPTICDSCEHSRCPPR